MRQGMLSLVLAALAATVAPAADARVNVSIGVGIDPYGYGAYAPPVVYSPDPYYYAAPPVVYIGGGSWGREHERRRPVRGHEERHERR